MLLMIVSDSHAMNKQMLLSILKQHNVDYYLHCGDIFMTYDGLPLTNFYLVKGNNDFADIPTERTLTFDTLTLFMTHGHLYDVNFGIDGLQHKSKEVQAQVVCFGHTHIPYVKQEDGVLYINPGSMSHPRGRYRNPTYALLDTTTMKVTFYDVKTNQVCDPFTFPKKKRFSFWNLFKQ